MYALVLENPFNSALRFFDGLITDAFGDSSDSAAGKISQGQQDIADGEVTKGEGEILEGTGQLLEEQAEKEASSKED